MSRHLSFTLTTTNRAIVEGMLHREAISVNLSESRYRGKLRERYQNLSRSRP